MVLIKSKPEQMKYSDSFPYGFNSILNSFFEESKIGTNKVNFMPQADIVDKSKHYEINLSLPGIRKEDLKIAVEGDLLTVEGERKQDNSEENDKFLRREISYGKFTRSFTLDKVDASRIEAAFNNGILNISLPKQVEELKSTNIAIK